MVRARLDPVLKRFVFISTCPEPWGGSEELWWAAACNLRGRGHSIAVLKTVVDDKHPRIRHLRDIGCRVTDLEQPGIARAAHAASVVAPRQGARNAGRSQMLFAAASLALRRPSLVVISQGQNFDGTHYAPVCGALGCGYVLISQKATELQWPPDNVRAYHGRAFSRALCSVFVSESNRKLTEEQLDITLDHALVLRNPVLAGHNGALPWPEGPPGEIRVACVGRLYVSEKGQDVLLRVIAQRHWRERRIKVRMYGEGRDRVGLMDLARRLGCDQVTFEGQCAHIEDVWRDHHALVLPSRAEGLPLALVEAMMCGRPAIVTDVGGNSEVVQDGVTGIIASAPSISALGPALDRFWAMRADWKQMGEAAAAHIRSLVLDDPGSVLAEHLLALARGRQKEVRAAW